MRERSLKAIAALARKNNRVVFVGSDLGPDVLRDFSLEYPERYLMEGISEQHLVSMAAGLAMEGFMPFVNTFGTFLTRRALEQIVVDVCLQNVPVRFLALGGGLVYAALGPTHCAVDDITCLRALPNITILTPCDGNEVTRLIDATTACSGPVYIRLAAGGDAEVSSPAAAIGRAYVLRQGDRVGIVSCGVMTQEAIAAAEGLTAAGIQTGVLHCNTVKPIDVDGLLKFVSSLSMLVTVEEHVLAGGFGSAVIETLADHEALARRRILRIGLPDTFITGYGSQKYLWQRYGLDAASIRERVVAALAL
jgi:transketolase